MPSWQQRRDAEEQEPLKDASPAQVPDSKTSRDDLREQASKFLDSEDLRDAPLKQKTDFLEKKGLTKDEIQSLLGNRDSSQDGMAADQDAEEEEGTPQEPTKWGEQPFGAAKSSTGDTPPIITYPEFLMHSQKPPPLITAQRLLTTFYVASGISALAYGTSKFVVEPMIESLTLSRHSLAEKAIEDLANLNRKLEGSVSALPDTLKAKSTSPTESNEDEDATSFFHRSAATQTSPCISRSSSSSSSPSAQQPAALDNEASKLRKVRDDLQELCGTESRQSAKKELNNLQTYLSMLTFSGSYPGPDGRSKEDGISKLKAEIRQTKGVLLSSRNFPSTAAARGMGSAGT